MADIYGRNPVLEALRGGGRVQRVLVAAGAAENAAMRAIVDEARRARVPVETVDRQTLDRRSGGGVHQGVVAVAGEFDYADIDTILKRGRGEPLLVLALDSVQDPQNLGSLLRTAEAAGVHGVLLPERRAVGVTPLVEKAAAGAAQFVPVVQVTNMVRALEQMKAAGAWVAGVENEPSAKLYDQADLSGPLVVVLGSEGRGLGRLVQATCDFLVRLPMRGRVSSLNVGVAGGIVLYEVLRQRRNKASQ